MQIICNILLYIFLYRENLVSKGFGVAFAADISNYSWVNEDSANICLSKNWKFALLFVTIILVFWIYL